MIDWDFESRLIDRIAARELIAGARLDSRQQRVLVGYFRHGDTLREVGEHEGISPERVRQIIARIFRLVHRVPADKASPHTRTVTPPGFDSAVFLRHMQALIARRAEERAIEARVAFERERFMFERERAALDHLIEAEQSPAAEKPKPLSSSMWQKLPSEWQKAPSPYQLSPEKSPPPPPMWAYLMSLKPPFPS